MKNRTKFIIAATVLTFALLLPALAAEGDSYGHDASMYCPVCEANTFWDHGCSDEPNTEAWITVDGVEYKYCPTDLICIDCGNHYRLSRDVAVHSHRVERDDGGVYISCPFKNDGESIYNVFPK